jgi:hypothetical protein
MVEETGKLNGGSCLRKKTIANFSSLFPQFLEDQTEFYP